MESVLVALVSGGLTLVGVLGVIVANLDLLVGASPVPVEFRAFAAALVMAVLSPVMAALGEAVGGDAR